MIRDIFRSWTLRGLFFRIFAGYALQKPELLTMIGILERFGYHMHNAKLNHASVEHEEQSYKGLHRAKVYLKGYALEKLSQDDQVSAKVISHYIEDFLAGYAFRHHDYPFNQMFGVQSSLPNFMMTLHPLKHKSDVKNYTKRLRAFNARIEQELVGLKIRENQGILPPRFAIDKVLEEMKAFIAVQPSDNPLYTTFVKRVKDFNAMGDKELTTESIKVLEAIATSVYPAYSRLIDCFSRFQTLTDRNDGVWALPNGDAYYHYCLKSLTTTTLTPSEIHEIGIREVRRIENEMLQILTQEGFPTEATSPVRLLATLAQEPRFKYPNTDEGREKCLKDFAQVIEAIGEKMPHYFNAQPKMPLKVDRIPVFKEHTATGAYYLPGDIGGNRPGHHYQIALASEKSKKPLFRRVLPFTAYAEGWAMYAELLAREMGMYDNDTLGLLGSLEQELFRAVRLVVDTGIHHKRWCREAAIQYLSDHSASPIETIISEVERYFVMPGQACTYKVGMLHFLSLRDRYKAAMGNHYSIKDFHDIVLGSGAVPLTVLDEILNNALMQRVTNPA